MRVFTIYLLIIVSFLSCDNSSKSNNVLKKDSIRLTALGVEQSWQKSPVRKNWYEAKKYCQDLILDGYSDWRVPSTKEFFALIDNNRSIDEQFPKSSIIKSFWSSDEFALDSKKAWEVDTWSNTEAYLDKNKTLGVRCIRGDSLDNSAYKDKNGKELEWEESNISKDALFTYSEAKAYCKAINKRLPTIFELQNSSDKSSFETPFKNIDKNSALGYWSSTALPTDHKSYMTFNYKLSKVGFSKNSEYNRAICVNRKNHIPTVTKNRVFNLNINENKEINLSGYDADNDRLYVEIIQPFTLGEFKDGVYSAINSGTDTLIYKVCDAISCSQQATITININKPNNPPHVYDKNITTYQDTKNINLVATDEDNDTLSFKIIDYPQHGILSLNNNKVTYIPSQSYIGDDSFTYQASDGESDSNTATVHIKIYKKASPSDSPPLNKAPVANIEIVKKDYNHIILSAKKSSDSDGSISKYLWLIDNQISGSNDILDINLSKGSHTIKLTVTDNGNLSDTSSLDLNINYPTIDVKIPKITLNEGEKILDSNINVSSGVDLKFRALKDVDGFSLKENGIFSFDASVDSYKSLKENEKFTLNIPINIKDRFNQEINSTINIEITGKNSAPKAVISRDKETVYKGETITFDANMSYDIDGDLLSYKWIFNDHNISTDNILQMSFSNTGIQTVKLIVTDEYNLTSMATMDIQVVNKNISFNQIKIDSKNGYKISWISTGDIDNDGDIDFIVSYKSKLLSSLDKISLYENIGSNNFQEQTVASNISGNMIELKDLDYDNDLDLIISGKTLDICNNLDKSVQFECSSKIANGNLSSFTISNFDLDSQNDIALISKIDNQIKFFMQLDKNSFSSPNKAFDIGRIVNWIDSGDYDGDGDIDFTVAYDGGVKYFENNNSMKFNTPTDLLKNSIDTKTISSANINNIGNIDFITTHPNSIRWSTIIFTQLNKYRVVDQNIKNPPYAFGVDIDKDGDIDIVSNSYEENGEIVWYENVKKSHITRFNKRIIKSNIDYITITKTGDFDKDGKVDIISGDNSGNIYIFYQN